jgi:hypothetical protein
MFDWGDKPHNLCGNSYFLRTKITSMDKNPVPLMQIVNKISMFAKIEVFEKSKVLKIVLKDIKKMLKNTN